MTAPYEQEKLDEAERTREQIVIETDENGTCWDELCNCNTCTYTRIATPEGRIETTIEHHN